MAPFPVPARRTGYVDLCITGSGRGRRKRTRTTGTSSAAYFTRRVHGELLVLGVKVATSTVWEILKDADIDPAPQRTGSTWATFLRSQANALLACDFIETLTLTGVRMYILAVIDHTSRRSVSWAPPPTRRRRGRLRSYVTSSWTSKTPAAGPDT